MDHILIFIDQNPLFVVSLLLLALIVVRFIGRRLQHTSKKQKHDDTHFTSEGHKTRLK